MSRQRIYWNRNTNIKFSVLPQETSSENSSEQEQSTDESKENVLAQEQAVENQSSANSTNAVSPEGLANFEAIKAFLEKETQKLNAEIEEINKSSAEIKAKAEELISQNEKLDQEITTQSAEIKAKHKRLDEFTISLIELIQEKYNQAQTNELTPEEQETYQQSFSDSIKAQLAEYKKKRQDSLSKQNHTQDNLNVEQDQAPAQNQIEQQQMQMLAQAQAQNQIEQQQMQMQMQAQAQHQFEQQQMQMQAQAQAQNQIEQQQMQMQMQAQAQHQFEQQQMQMQAQANAQNQNAQTHMQTQAEAMAQAQAYATFHGLNDLASTPAYNATRISALTGKPYRPEADIYVQRNIQFDYFERMLAFLINKNLTVAYFDERYAYAPNDIIFIQTPLNYMPSNNTFVLTPNKQDTWNFLKYALSTFKHKSL